MNKELKHLFSVPSVSSVAFNRRTSGSALLLAVVLSSILAVIGALFLMTSRIERMGTTAIAENKDLDSAVDSVVAAVSRELVLDTPGVRFGVVEEYYDYPDLANRWLANLEPYKDISGNYRWRRISDVIGFPLISTYDTNNVPAVIVPDNQQILLIDPNADADGDGVSDSKWIQLGNMTSGKGKPIYAAVRVIDNGAMLNVNTAYLFDPNSQQSNRVDGFKQTQINLIALSKRDNTHTAIGEKQSRLDLSRCGDGAESNDISLYEENVVQYYNHVIGKYTPFDISDELKLRNRYFLNNNNIKTRIEGLWRDVYDGGLEMPRINQFDLQTKPNEWFYRVNNRSPDPNIYNYRHISTTYNMDRIITPAGNEKMINIKAVANANVLYSAIRAGFFDAGFTDDLLAAQLAVNIKDYGDTDSRVSVFTPDSVNYYYGFERPCIYISEIVHVYANSEVASDPNHNSFAIELHKPYYEDLAPDLALELLDRWHLMIDKDGLGFNPADDINVPIDWSGTPRFHVIKWEDPCAPVKAIWYEPNKPNPPDGAMGVGNELILYWMDTNVDSYDVYFGTDYDAVFNADNTSPVFRSNTDSNTYDTSDFKPGGLKFGTTYYWRIDDIKGPDTTVGQVWSFTTTVAAFSPPAEQIPVWNGDPVFSADSVIELRRFAENGDRVVVDSVVVVPSLVPETETPGTRSMQRDINKHKCIRRLWSEDAIPDSNLGYNNSYTDPDVELIQAHPANKFTNVGEIGMVFDVNVYDGTIITGAVEENVRVDLRNKPAFWYLFNYLRRMEPDNDDIDNDGDNYKDDLDVNEPEWKIPGRININTAPWYVIAQLPWVSQKLDRPFDPNLARAIVGYRDRLNLTPGGPDYSTAPGLAGFRSIGELNNVIHSNPSWSMDYYIDTDDQVTFPDLTPDDGAPDDFEERDLIFARISDLVTVRSDVFTAYILVRIGVDGPQKRAIAILDRSDVYPDPFIVGNVIGKVKIRALHLVPDPR